MAMKFKHAAILIIRGVLVGGLLGGLISFVFRLDIASGAIGAGSYQLASGWHFVRWQ